MDDDRTIQGDNFNDEELNEELEDEEAYETDNESSYSDTNMYEFFESEDTLRFLDMSETQDSDEQEEDIEEDDIEEDDIEEDDIDPDELSYEELLALGEFIGKEKRGLSIEEISACLTPYILKVPSDANGSEQAMCVICQVQYEMGESLASLPCAHSYHSDCITKWLMINKTCPICSSQISL